MEALIKQDESQGCLNANNYTGSALWPMAGEGGCSEEGIKTDKISHKNHAKNINTFHTIYIEKNDHE